MKKILLFILIIVPFALLGQNNVATFIPPQKTGNDSIDQANSAKAKYQWIVNNPEDYRAQGGDPEYVIKEFNKNDGAHIGDTIYYSPVDLSDSSLYKLFSVDAVDINNKHTVDEMAVFKKNAKEEINRMNIVINWEKHLWYYIPRNTQKKPRIKEFTVADNQILFTNCKECEDNKFTIVAKTSRGLTLQLKPQDEGNNFVYQMEFKK